MFIFLTGSSFFFCSGPIYIHVSMAVCDSVCMCICIYLGLDIFVVEHFHCHVTAIYTNIICIFTFCGGCEHMPNAVYTKFITVK